MNIEALIPAAGSGRRMGERIPKLLLTIKGKPVIIHTLEVFQRNQAISGIMIAVSPGELPIFRNLIEEYGITKVSSLIPGGAERQDSVYNMLKSLQSPDLVAIHDGARPLLTDEDLLRVLEIPEDCDGTVLGAPLKDTIKQIDCERLILSTPDRDEFWIAQTPQVFYFDKLLKAYEKALQNHLKVTDDASIIEHYGGKVKIIPGNFENMKITIKEDIYLAEAILERRGMSNG